MSVDEASTVSPDVPGPHPSRLVFIDNLRWSAIAMVVVIHAAVTYSGVGSWYVRDRINTTRPEVVGLATYQSIQHAVAMGLLFGIAGYFASGALARRSIPSFLRERSYRLGLPLLMYLFVIGPLTEYYVAGSWRPRPPRGLVEEYLQRVADGRLFGGSGPLWFCLVLLVFSYGFAGFEALRRRRGASIRRVSVPGPVAMAGFALAMAAITFLLGGLAPDAGTILNVVVHDLPQYPLMFCAGILAQRGDWLSRFPRSYAVVGLLVGLVGGLCWWFPMLELGGAFRGDLPLFGGGWHWQALAMDLWRAGVCVSLGVGLITLYRDRFGGQNRASRFLTRSAFGVYLFHPPILIAITVALRGWPADSLLKFAIASAAAVVSTFLFVGLVARRTPVLRAVI